MRGPNYHWVIDLYERLNLPVVSAVVQALHKATADRIANLEKQKTEEGNQRIHMKVTRAEDQEARKKWGKQQAVRHTYGNEESDGDDVDNANLVKYITQMVGNEESITVESAISPVLSTRERISLKLHNLKPIKYNLVLIIVTKNCGLFCKFRIVSGRPDRFGSIDIT